MAIPRFNLRQSQAPEEEGAAADPYTEESEPKELQDRVDRAIDLDSDAELMALGRDIVDLHGQMVLLENYSLLNYTGLVKIIKKYDKRTGALHRLPFIQEVLNQPFFKIDVVNKLVKECEIILSILFPLCEGPSFSTNENYDHENNNNRNNETSGEIPKMQEVPEEVLDEIENMENDFHQINFDSTSNPQRDSEPWKLFFNSKHLEDE